MTYTVIIMNCRGEIEKYNFEEQYRANAERVYNNHVYMFNDMMVLLLQCRGKAVEPIATYYRQYD